MKNIILFLATLALLSCGARKTQKLETKAEVKTEATAAEKTNTIITTDSKIEGESEILTETYTPADPAKPMVIDDGKGNKSTVINGKKTITKKKGTTKAAVKTTTTIAAAKTIQVKAVAKTESKAKDTQREASFGGIYLIGGIIIGVVVVIWFVWFLWRKYKNSTPV